MSDLADSSPLIVVAAALQNDQGDVLICKKDKGPLKGLWELPGGKVEAGETLVDALKRELLEELCVAVELEPEAFAEATGSVGDRLIKLIGFRGRIASGQVDLVEHSQSQWVPLDTIDLKILGPLDQELVKKW